MARVWIRMHIAPPALVALDVDIGELVSMLLRTDAR